MLASDNSNRPLITLSIAAYNEEGNVERLLQRITAFAAGQPDYRFEFLFTDNASTDRTFELLAAAARRDPRIRVLQLSRNFGVQRSLLTNYLNARGDAAIQLDADLQDPPELAAEFLALWRQGYKVVYGIRRRRKEGWAINWLRRRFYAVVTALSDVEVPRDAGDFRLIDRVIINHLSEFKESAPYLRGIIASLGYPQTGIPYDRDMRRAGKSKFGWTDLVRFAIDGLVNQSTRPLHIITQFGIWTSLLAFLASLFYLGVYVFSNSTQPSGFMTLVLLILFSMGVNAAILGTIGEYVGRIYNNVRSGPLTIIANRIESINVSQGLPEDKN